MTPEPIFLLSAPRCGSTLLQRILAAHPEVATLSEPWVLLPLLYAERGEGVYAEYAHVDFARAFTDVCRALPNGRQDWYAAVRAYAGEIYARAAGRETRYFLDKTPRYSLAAEELFRAFPDSRFVVLWRHPLAMLASILNTWHGGRWNLHYFKADVFCGVERLIRAVQAQPGRAFALRYEDVVREPEKRLRSVFSYLDLDWDPDVLHGFEDIHLGGRMGDQTGTRRYREISVASLDHWKSTLANPLRKAWCRRYLRWLGQERLAFMGYELDALLAELDALTASRRHLASDALRMPYGLLYSTFEPRQLRRKLSRLPQLHRLHAHR